MKEVGPRPSMTDACAKTNYSAGTKLTLLLLLPYQAKADHAVHRHQDLVPHDHDDNYEKMLPDVFSNTTRALTCVRARAYHGMRNTSGLRCYRRTEPFAHAQRF